MCACFIPYSLNRSNNVFLTFRPRGIDEKTLLLWQNMQFIHNARCFLFYILLFADLWNLIWLQSTSYRGDTGSFKTPAFIKILCMLSAWVLLSELKYRIKETSCGPLKLWCHMSSNCRQGFHCCLRAVFSSLTDQVFS